MADVFEIDIDSETARTSTSPLSRSRTGSRSGSPPGSRAGTDGDARGTPTPVRISPSGPDSATLVAAPELGSSIPVAIPSPRKVAKASPAEHAALTGAEAAKSAATADPLAHAPPAPSGAGALSADFVPPHTLSLREPSVLQNSVPLSTSSRIRTRNKVLQSTGFLPGNATTEGFLVSRTYGDSATAGSRAGDGPTSVSGFGELSADALDGLYGAPTALGSASGAARGGGEDGGAAAAEGASSDLGRAASVISAQLSIPAPVPEQRTLDS